VPLDQAKIINIQGTPLSLKDIREKIVYANWKSPDVIYGFFTGTIGSPSIQAYAYTAANVRKLLDRNAVEYTNSLRGFRRFGETRYISSLYKSVNNFYFRDFNNDVAKHFSDHMRAEIYADYAQGGKLNTAIKDAYIADLVNGEPKNTRIYLDQLAAPGQAFTANSQGGIDGTTFIGGVDTTAALGDLRGRARARSNLNVMLHELREKYHEQKSQGLAGRVEIEDIETIDPDIE